MFERDERLVEDDQAFAKRQQEPALRGRRADIGRGLRRRRARGRGVGVAVGTGSGVGTGVGVAVGVGVRATAVTTRTGSAALLSRGSGTKIEIAATRTSAHRTMPKPVNRHALMAPHSQQPQTVRWGTVPLPRGLNPNSPTGAAGNRVRALVRLRASRGSGSVAP